MKLVAWARARARRGALRPRWSRCWCATKTFSAMWTMCSTPCACAATCWATRCFTGAAPGKLPRQRRGGRCGRGPARGGRARHAVVGPAACGRRDAGRHAPGRYPAALFRRGRGAACPALGGAAQLCGRAKGSAPFGARGGTRRCARRTGKGQSRRFAKTPFACWQNRGLCV